MTASILERATHAGEYIKGAEGKSLLITADTFLNAQSERLPALLHPLVRLLQKKKAPPFQTETSQTETSSASVSVHP